jgi:hypothetical protein
MLLGGRKLRQVAQRLEHFAVPLAGQINLARIAVVEAQKQPMSGRAGLPRSYAASWHSLQQVDLELHHLAPLW